MLFAVLLAGCGPQVEEIDRYGSARADGCADRRADSTADNSACCHEYGYAERTNRYTQTRTGGDRASSQ